MKSTLEHAGSVDAVAGAAPKRYAKLSRPAWHFLVDVALLAALLLVVAVFGVLQFIFPAGTQAAGWQLWGLGYDAWSNVRFGAFATFLILIIVHVMLQWNWVCNFVTTRVSRWTGRRTVVPPAVRTIYGVGFLILLLTVLGGFLLAAELMIQAPTP